MFYWDSFWELNTTRHELSPIPWTAINSYCERWGIVTPEEFDSFLFFIRVLDNEFLSIKNKEIERERNISMSKNKSKSKRK